MVTTVVKVWYRRQRLIGEAEALIRRLARGARTARAVGDEAREARIVRLQARALRRWRRRRRPLDEATRPSSWV